MNQTPDELRSHEGELGQQTESDFSQEQREKNIPVRTEQERLREIEVEQIEKKILDVEREIPEQAREVPSNGPVPSTAPLSSVDPLTKQIENILSDDLISMYRTMSPEQQEVFRREGERTAGVIRQMLEHVKIKTSSLLEVIKKWLRLIPGVNKFFLEQEAKIKADKVIQLHKKVHGPSHD